VNIDWNMAWQSAQVLGLAYAVIVTAVLWLTRR